MNTTCQHCGLVNDFYIIRKSNQDTAWCSGCDKSMGNAPQGGEPMLHFGKYKGRQIKTMLTADEIDYLKWLLQQSFCKGKLKNDIQTHLSSIGNV